MEGNWNNISKMSYTSTLNQWHHFQKKYPKDQLAKKKKNMHKVIGNIITVKEYKQNKCPYQWGPS